MHIIMSAIENKRKSTITRKCFSIEEKNAIIRLLETGESNASISKKFGISQSTISSIKKNKHKIEFLYNSNNLKRKRMRTSTQEQVDEVLLQWYKLTHKQGILVTGPMLQEKANFFSKQLKIEPAFYCSASWIQRFKVRHNILNGKIDGESLPNVHSDHNDQLRDYDTESSDYEAFSLEEIELINTLTPEITIDFVGQKLTEPNIQEECKNNETELNIEQCLIRKVNSSEVQSFPTNYENYGKAKDSEVSI